MEILWCVYFDFLLHMQIWAYIYVHVVSVVPVSYDIFQKGLQISWMSEADGMWRKKEIFKSRYEDLIITTWVLYIEIRMFWKWLEYNSAMLFWKLTATGTWTQDFPFNIASVHSCKKCHFGSLTKAFHWCRDKSVHVRMHSVHITPMGCLHLTP